MLAKFRLSFKTSVGLDFYVLTSLKSRSLSFGLMLIGSGNIEATEILVRRHYNYSHLKYRAGCHPSFFRTVKFPILTLLSFPSFIQLLFAWKTPTYYLIFLLRRLASSALNLFPHFNIDSPSFHFD